MCWWGLRHPLFRGVMKKRPLVNWDYHGLWETLLSWMIHLDVHSEWLCSFCSKLFKLSLSWAQRCYQKNGFHGKVRQSVQILHCVIQHGTLKYRKMEYMGFMSLCKQEEKRLDSLLHFLGNKHTWWLHFPVRGKEQQRTLIIPSSWLLVSIQCFTKQTPCG